jgi:hypothetical protein
MTLNNKIEHLNLRGARRGTSSDGNCDADNHSLDKASSSLSRILDRGNLQGAAKGSLQFQEESWYVTIGLWHMPYIIHPVPASLLPPSAAPLSPVILILNCILLTFLDTQALLEKAP